ncbi:MAG: hypothetical protein Q8N99_03460 [Nanoarchaeota archaeon]|nr:hypothetical protein [Nanoarchaeota archaeon]
MSLEIIKDNNKVTFFNMFVKEMLKNSGEEHFLKPKIDAEKIKRKYLDKGVTTEEAFRRFLSVTNADKNNFKRFENMKKSPFKIFPEKNNSKDFYIEDKKLIKKYTPIYNRTMNKPSIAKKPMIVKTQMNNPNYHIFDIPQRKPIVQTTTQVMQKIEPNVKSIQSPAVEREEKIVFPKNLPKREITPMESGYKKIEPILKDATIQMIECPGPGKNLLVKKYDKINVTRLTLSQSQITDIISEFSKQARIPPVGGILKAAIGNMIISAVISEFVGSRFIINKSTPYSLIYK